MKGGPPSFPYVAKTFLMPFTTAYVYGNWKLACMGYATGDAVNEHCRMRWVLDIGVTGYTGRDLRRDLDSNFHESIYAKALRVLGSAYPYPLNYKVYLGAGEFGRAIVYMNGWKDFQLSLSDIGNLRIAIGVPLGGRGIPPTYVENLKRALAPLFHREKMKKGVLPPFTYIMFMYHIY